MERRVTLAQKTSYKYALEITIYGMRIALNLGLNKLS